MLFKTSKKKTNGSRHRLTILKNSLVKFKPLNVSIKKTQNKTFNNYRYDNKKLNPLLQTGVLVGKDKDNFRTNFLILVKFMCGAYTYLPASANLISNQFFFF